MTFNAFYCRILVPGKGKTKYAYMEMCKPLINVIFHFMDRVKKFKLSKDVSIYWLSNLAYRITFYYHCVLKLALLLNLCVKGIGNKVA